MSRPLWIALIAVLSMTLYVMNTEGDDELLAPARQGERQGAEQNGPRGDARLSRGDGSGARRMQSARGATPSSKDQPDPALAQALMEGVAAWQARASSAPQQPRIVAAQPGPGGWAGLAPPRPAPSAQAMQAAEPPPMAPPFPREWVGRFNDAGGSQPAVERAVLAGPRNTLIVQRGDVIEGQWRVDGIQGRTMTLTYLPLNQPQTVAMK